MVRRHGVYIHIPFCRRRCAYCGFNSVPAGGRVPGAYVEALLTDISRQEEAWGEMPPASVYLGGGTPSLLTPGELERILAALPGGLSPDSEVTLECNPEGLDPGRLRAYRELGVNRLSLGVQSLNDRDLRFLERTHDSAAAGRAVESAREAGFENLSADLMIGLPGQKTSCLVSDLRSLASHLQHLSIYMLSVEEGTPLAGLEKAGLLRLPAEEKTVELYLAAGECLEELGFGRYEISNWCRPGRGCHHNLNYWLCGDYLGVGAGAHSHRSGRRFARVGDPRRYAEAVRTGAGLLDMEETLTREQRLLEKVMLGLRLSCGVDASEIEGASARGARAVSFLSSLVESGEVTKEGRRLQLSAKGILVHDTISEGLAEVLHSSISVCNKE
jgi:oxygen-independent coproporphyrinogen-3 oxidase